MSFFSQNNSKNLNNETFNVVQSISKAKILYKNLIIKAHPDKNLEKINLATELTRLINLNKFNYRELLLLEERINLELDKKQ